MRDIIYYHWDPYGSEVRIAGGRFRIPVWLLWTTWGIVAAVVIITDIVVSCVTGTVTGADFPWMSSVWFLLFTVGWIGLYWVIYLVARLIGAWVDVIRKGL